MIVISNYWDEDSFLGSNFLFWFYFIEVVSGEMLMFYVLGMILGEWGFFFLVLVLDGVEILGVIVVKMLVGFIE